MDYQFFREKGYFKFPPILQIEITQKCPLSCPQCYKNLDEKEMPFDFLKDSIINASRNGTKHIVLNGGEPFVYSKIFDVLEIVDRLDVQVTLFTSGYGIHLEEVQALKVYQNLHIGVSFNGSCEAIHSLSRDGFDISYAFTSNKCQSILEYAKKVGFTLLRICDITKNVLQSCKAISKNRIEVLGKSYREMIGAPGSSFFTQMENGILRYKVFYFTKKNE